MVGFRFLLAGTAMLVLAAPLSAQQSTGIVTGRVVDRQTTRPLAAAQVRVSGTNRGASTDEAGSFRITGLPAGATILIAQRIGYAPVTRTVTVAADGAVTADFGLTASATTLDQVIVTATGQTERRRESGASTATIDGSQVVKAAVSTFADVLSSRSPGVVVQQAAGESGAGSRIRIRGSNSISLSNDPLMIVDGIRVDNSANSTAIGTGGQQPSRYNDINPENIESIEIIKGPAAASLYGTAAANGVIQITTKKGRAGKTKWDGYLEYGNLTDVNEYPANFRSFGKTATGTLVGNCSLFSRVSTAATKCVGVDSTINHFPLDAASMIDDGNRRIAGLSASGGGETATYFLAGEYQKEQNVIEVNAQQRLNMRTNLRGQLAKNLDAQISIGYSNSDLRRPQNDNNAFGVVSGSLLGKAADCGPGGLAAQHPTLCVNGAGAIDSVSRGYFNGYLAPKAFYNINTRQGIQRLTGGLTSNWTPTSWLSLNGTFGGDVDQRSDHETLQPAVLAYNQNTLDGYRNVFRAQVYNYTAGLNGQAVYSFSPSLKFTTTLGTQYTDVFFARTDAQGAKLLGGTNSLAGTNARFVVSEQTSDVRTLGFIAREQLAWRDRVFLVAGVRTDRNSAFGTNFPRIYYPSISSSWVVSEEGFFPKVDAISSLRVRAAIGSAGQNPGYLAAEQTLSPVAVVAAGTDFPGFTVGGAGNPNLKPERSREVEAGFDVGLLHDRLYFEYTHYDKSTKDALVNVNLAPSLGSSPSRFQNLGKVRNYGDELLARVMVLDRRNVKFDFTANGSWNTNNLDDLGVDALGNPIPPVFFNGSTQVFKTGFPLGAYFVKPITSFTDLNGDGLIGCPTGPAPAAGSATCEVTLGDSAVFRGTPFPKLELSFSPQLSIGNFIRMSATFDRRTGQKLFNNTAYFRNVSIGNGAAVQMPSSANLREQAAATAGRFSGANFTYDGFIENSSFTKLREVAITLSLPQRIAARAGAASADLTFAGRNLKTWSDYSGVDPEVNSVAQAQFSTSDFLTLPQVRYFTARLALSF
ncbi:MAG: SusC/RagA family TonB-linked outer membrane protein [Gemmatimonadaceae bacterium]